MDAAQGVPVIIGEEIGNTVRGIVGRTDAVTDVEVLCGDDRSLVDPVKGTPLKLEDAGWIGIVAYGQRVGKRDAPDVKAKAQEREASQRRGGAPAQADAEMIARIVGYHLR